MPAVMAGKISDDGSMVVISFLLSPSSSGDLPRSLQSFLMCIGCGAESPRSHILIVSLETASFVARLSCVYPASFLACSKLSLFIFSCSYPSEKTIKTNILYLFFFCIFIIEIFYAQNSAKILQESYNLFLYRSFDYDYTHDQRGFGGQWLSILISACQSLFGIVAYLRCV